jgi:hypothetical protein
MKESCGPEDQTLSPSIARRGATRTVGTRFFLRGDAAGVIAAARLASRDAGLTGESTRSRDGKGSVRKRPQLYEVKGLALIPGGCGVTACWLMTDSRWPGALETVSLGGSGRWSHPRTVGTAAGGAARAAVGQATAAPRGRVVHVSRPSRGPVGQQPWRAADPPGGDRAQEQLRQHEHGRSRNAGGPDERLPHAEATRSQPDLRDLGGHPRLPRTGKLPPLPEPITANG